MLYCYGLAASSGIGTELILVSDRASGRVGRGALARSPNAYGGDVRRREIRLATFLTTATARSKCRDLSKKKSAP